MKRPPLTLQLAAVVLVALYGIQRALPEGFTVGDGVDAYGTLWFYWWMKHALLTGQDPGFTDLFFHPLGKDIFGHTGSNLLDAAASVPFQLALGHPGYQKWFVVALMVANALAFVPLARRLLPQAPWAAFAATLAWELNPLVLFEITCGRFTQAFLPFLPLALNHFLALRDDRRWRHALLAGGFTALVGYAYWFYGFALALALGWLAVADLLRATDRRGLAARYLAAGATCLVLVAPAAIPMAALSAAGEVPGITGFAGGSIWEGPVSVRNNVAQTLHGYLLLERHGPSVLATVGTGLPLVPWALLGPGRLRWLPAFALVMLFALGPTVQGHVMPHYMAAYWYLPFFQRLWFPYRLAMVAMVPAALAVGFLAARLGPRLRLAVPLLVVLVTTVEQARFAIFPFVARDARPPAVMAWVGEHGGGLLDLPFGIYSEAVIWQTFHEQPLFGGMGENAPLLWPEGMKERTREPFVHALIGAAKRPDRPVEVLPSSARDPIVADGFRWVVLHRDLVRQPVREKRDLRARTLDNFVELLGAPTATDGSLVVWDLQGTATAPEHLRATDERLEAPYTIPDPRPEYEKRLEEGGHILRGRTQP